MKRKFTNKRYNNLEQVSEFISEATTSLSADRIKSTCSFANILQGINRTN